MKGHFSIGDIIQGTLRGRDEAYHPIIYLWDINDNYFRGGMITHSSGFGNIRLQNYHFSQRIKNNIRPSYFVNNYLIKKQNWGPFHKIGKLSKKGIRFVQSHLSGSTPRLWEDHI